MKMTRQKYLPYRRMLTTFLFVLLCCFLLTACYDLNTSSYNQPAGSIQDQQNMPHEDPLQNPGVQNDKEPLRVHFIDVGQADCILIQAPSGKNMLIDAGNNGDAEHVLFYLKNLGIKRLDIVVGTHPHSDHIGSLDKVIDAFDIGQVVMPNVTTTTQTFKDVLTAISNKGLKITTAQVGNTLDLGETVTAVILAPNSAHYDELNNYSVVIRLGYGSTSFLFTGDAQTLSESEILSNGKDIQSNVLKVGHHGSFSSTSQSFLDQVNPQYTIIMAGKDNDYHHPHQVTLTKLTEIGAKIFRTDRNGTIIISSDGSTISCISEKE